MTDARFLSVPEAAAALGISDDLVYKLIERGELPAIALGRRKVVPADAIDLVITRAMDGFDPDALLATLATAVDASGRGTGVHVNGASTGTAESTTARRRPRRSGADPEAAAAQAASVVPLSSVT